MTKPKIAEVYRKRRFPTVWVESSQGSVGATGGEFRCLPEGPGFRRATDCILFVRKDGTRLPVDIVCLFQFFSGLIPGEACHNRIAIFPLCLETYRKKQR